MSLISTGCIIAGMLNSIELSSYEGRSSPRHETSSRLRSVRNLGGATIGLALGVEVAGAVFGFGGAGLAVASVAAMEVGAVTAFSAIVAESIVEGI